jgi:hypothetical protein
MAVILVAFLFTLWVFADLDLCPLRAVLVFRRHVDAFPLTRARMRRGRLPLHDMLAELAWRQGGWMRWLLCGEKNQAQQHTDQSHDVVRPSTSHCTHG